MLRKLFIDENCHATFLENKIILRNTEKDIQEELKGGKFYNLFRIKNSSLLAHVRIETNDLHNPRGSTTIISIEDFKEIIMLEVPLDTKSTALNNGMLIGMFGQNIILHEPKMRQDSFYLQRNNNLNEIVAISNNAIASIFEEYANVHSIIPQEFSSLYLFRIASLEKAVKLSGDLFLTKIKQSSFLNFRIYNLSGTCLKDKFYPFMIDFKNFTFLPEQEVVIGLSKEGKLYSIDIDNLDLNQVQITLSKKIEDIYLTKNNELLGVFEDGNFVNLDNKNEIFNQLCQDDSRTATVVLNLIAEYAAEMLFFSKKTIKKEEEVKESLQLKK